MAVYEFDRFLVLDAQGRPAINATGEFFDKDDTSFTTPLEVTDLNGLPLIATTDTLGLGPSFQVEHDEPRVVWHSSDGFPSMPLLSLEAVVAVAADVTEAKALAESAASTASSAESVAADALSTANGVETIATQAQSDATAAAGTAASAEAAAGEASTKADDALTTAVVKAQVRAETSAPAVVATDLWYDRVSGRVAKGDADELVNLHPNPRYEGTISKSGGGAGSWTFTRQATGGPLGLGWLRLTPTGSATGNVEIGSETGTVAEAAVTAGLTYTLSVHTLSTNTGESLAVRARFYNGSNVLVGSPFDGTDVSADGEWHRASVTAVAPAGAVKVRMVVLLKYNAGNPTGVADTVGVFGRQVVEGSVPGDYTDGYMHTAHFSGTPGASASARTPGWVAPPRGVDSLNLRDFGAVGDGVADDSPAIREWVAALVVSRHGQGHAPAGTYRMGSVVTADLTADHLSIQGAGVESTQFLVDNATGGFAFTSGAPVTGHLTMRSLTLMTDKVGEGTALSFIGPASSGARYERTVTLYDIVIRGLNTTSHVFEYGVRLSGVWRPHLSSVLISGPTDPSVRSDYSDESPLFVGKAGFKLDNSYGPFLVDCNTWGYSTGVEDIGTNAEGGHVVRGSYVQCKNGIVRYRTGREPGLNMTNVHVNVRDTGVEITGTRFAFIEGLLAYNMTNASDGSAASGGDTVAPRDIWLKNTNNIDVRNCVFTGRANPTRVNVHVDSAVYGREIRVTGNTFDCAPDLAGTATGVQVGSGAQAVVLFNNRFTAGSNYSAKVTDAGTGTIVASDLSVGAADSGGTGFRMLRVTN